MAEAARDRDDRQRELLAWVTANLMNASGNMKSRMTVTELLGQPPRAQRWQKVRRRPKKEN
jgi:hypothetical protein